MEKEKMFEKYWKPFSISDYHIFIFIVKAVIIVISILLCVKIVTGLDGNSYLEKQKGKHFMKLSYT